MGGITGITSIMLPPHPYPLTDWWEMSKGGGQTQTEVFSPSGVKVSSLIEKKMIRCRRAAVHLPEALRPEEEEKKIVLLES